ncbi:hypothetical protein, partial [Hydrogenophaga sp.]|uniref:hypothetical protein n=1 Tax=Hydrogenophaga sp. TaxID=1904254 RepID=UPI0025B81777
LPSTTRLPNRPKSSVPTSIFSVQFGFGIARSFDQDSIPRFWAHKGNVVLFYGGYGEISGLSPVAVQAWLQGEYPSIGCIALTEAEANYWRTQAQASSTTTSAKESAKQRGLEP